MTGPYQVLSSYEEDPHRPDERGFKFGVWVYVVDHETDGVVLETQHQVEAFRYASAMNAAASALAG